MSGVQIGMEGMPSRSRRLVLTQGGTAWWGVDSSTKSVAIGCVTADGVRAVYEETFPRLSGPMRLSAIVAITASLASAMAATAAPGWVGIEKPAASGRGTNFPMLYAVAAIQAGVSRGIARGQAAQPSYDDEVIAASWKKLVCGYGGIRKPDPKQVREGATYAVHDWARAGGWAVGSSWNMADAAAIAVFGEQTVELRAR